MGLWWRIGVVMVVGVVFGAIVLMGLDWVLGCGMGSKGLLGMG